MPPDDGIVEVPVDTIPIEEKKMAALLKYGFGKSRMPKIPKQKNNLEEDDTIGE